MSACKESDLRDVREPALVRYYDRELDYLRKAAGDFAEKHPKIGGRLRLSAEAGDEPHVERAARPGGAAPAVDDRSAETFTLDGEFARLIGGLTEAAGLSYSLWWAMDAGERLQFCRAYAGLPPSDQFIHFFRTDDQPARTIGMSRAAGAAEPRPRAVRSHRDRDMANSERRGSAKGGRW
jgi:Type VI secretion system, TssF